MIYAIISCLQIGEEISAVVSEFELHKIEGTSVNPITFQMGSIPRKHAIVTSNDTKVLNQVVAKNQYQDTLIEKYLHSSESSGLQSASRQQEEAETLAQRVVDVAKDPSKAREIVRWLAEQDLLSVDSLRLLDPKTECPSHWPLGWKTTLQIVKKNLPPETP